jgi:autotransporter-associated beta strand protein
MSSLCRLRKGIVFTVLLHLIWTLTVRAITIDTVYFAQTHVQEASHAYLNLVGNREMLIKAHVVAPGGIPAPAVQAVLTLDGQTLNLPLTGPAVLPVSIPKGPGVVQHSFADTFTGTVPKAWVKRGLSVSVQAGAATANYNNLLIGAPNKVIMNMIDVHYFAQASGNYPNGWQEELAAKWPVAELELRRLPNVVFPELVIPPRAGVKAARVKSRADYLAQTGLAFDGEQGAALAWNSALKRAAGTSGRVSLYYTNIYGVSAGGQAGGFAGVGSGTSVGILHHELGHALSLPHWGDSASYPYKGDMHGIPAPAIYNGTHAGPSWAYDLRLKAFIPCTTQPGNVGNRTVGTYKADPMQGGGTGFQEPPYLMNHFSDYSVRQMRNYLDGHVLRWNESLNRYASWSSTTRDYTNTVTNNGVQYPLQRDVEVISVLASVSGSNPGVNMVYPPIGPYTSGLIRLFDPRISADRSAAASIYAPTNGCDTSVRVIQGGVEKFYMLAAAWEPTIDPLTGASLRTAAINLPASEGPVTRIDLLLTPDAQINGLPADPQVLYTWPSNLVAAPTGLVAVGGDGRVNLSWNSSPGATSYNIKRSLGPGGPYTQVGTTSATSFTDMPVSNGVMVYYVVTANNSTGESANSLEASALPQAAPPVPTGLVAVPGNSVVSLAWDASPGASHYHVKRGQSSSGPYTTIASVPGTSFTDFSVVNGVNYYYAVSALAGTTESADSSAVSAMPVGPPVAPLALTATGSDGLVSLSWNESPGASGYLVMRSPTSGGPYVELAVISNSSFIDTQVINGASYFYVVIARNSFGDSPASSEAVAAAVRARSWDGGTADLAGNGDGLSAGGSGTWNTVLKNWDPGASPFVAWDNSANDGAVFGGTAGTVTLGTGITVGGLRFDVANYILTGQTLTFGIAGSILNSGTTTINTPLAGGPAASISKYGNGTLIFGGNNTYQGSTTVHAGTLRFNAASAIGGSGRSVTAADDSAVAFNFPIGNAELNRLAQTNHSFEIHMLVPVGSTHLNLGASEGAALPNVTLRGQPNNTYSGTLSSNGVFRIGNLSTAVNFANANVFTISSGLSGAGNSVVIAGGSSQPVYLTGTNTYQGSTTVSPGAALGFNTANIDGIGGGPNSPDIHVGENASLLRQGGSLNNAFLKRIAETTNTFTIYANNAGSGSALDLSGTNGGRYLPNVSLATWDNVGTVSFAFTGTITPADHVYRFGGPRAGNFVNLTTANALTGANALVVTAGKVRLQNANNFSGDTLINGTNNGTLFITHSLALQNSAIDTSGDGRLDVASLANVTLGGLKGNKNAASVFNGTYVAVANLTLNALPDVINIYSGAITDGAPGMALTKTGGGTQILTGSSLYTGPTSVQDGILLVSGSGSLAPQSLVTVSGGTLGGDGLIGGSVTVTGYGSLAPGAPLGTLTIGGNLDLSGMPTGETRKIGFEILNAASSDRIAVSGTLALGAGLLGFDDFNFSFPGGIQAGVYKLITSSGITGSLAPEAQLSGLIEDLQATIRINGYDLELVVASGIPPYHVWAHGFADLDDENPASDSDGGGLPTGIEWVVGGDPTDPNDDAALAPTLDHTSDPNGKLLFVFRRTADAGAAPDTSITVQYGSDLEGWTSAVHQGSGPNEITITGQPNGFGTGVDRVTVALPVTSGGRQFVRLKVAVAEFAE